MRIELPIASIAQTGEASQEAGTRTDFAEILGRLLRNSNEADSIRPQFENEAWSLHARDPNDAPIATTTGSAAMLSRASSSTVAPRIGDSAVSFSEKHLLLLSAVEFVRAHDVVVADTVSSSIQPHLPSDPDLIGVSVSPHADARQIAEPNAAFSLSNLGRSDEKVLAHGAARTVPLALQNGPVPTGLHAAQSQNLNRFRQTGPQIVRADGPRSPAVSELSVKFAKRPVLQGALLANLLAIDSGYRVVVRAPAMKTEDRPELARRLASLFAEYGRSSPELLIYQPETAN